MVLARGLPGGTERHGVGDGAIHGVAGAGRILTGVMAAGVMAVDMVMVIHADIPMGSTTATAMVELGADHNLASVAFTTVSATVVLMGTRGC